MAFTDLASFPNSRIKSRPPTRTQKTYEINLIANTPYTFPSNPDRTRLDIRRDDTTTGSLKLAYDVSDLTANGLPIYIQEAYGVDTQDEIYLQSDVNMTIYIDEGQG